ncbi:hypothetical protein [Streptomyces sp.]|uniref:hypothetical protein n=1 Tax=Streptomyces sp. TaxID=1931 RepID=UPI002810D51A|nr:hypothetical protein [Streptomyces sp.]
MKTHSRAEAQFSLALDSIQGKRRVEQVLEAAQALLDRYAAQPDPVERLRLAFELIRRNFTGDIALIFGDLTLGAEGGDSGTARFHGTIRLADGRTGTLTAHYTEPGSMGLTNSEWLTAMRLLAGLAGLGAGGTVTWAA